MPRQSLGLWVIIELAALICSGGAAAATGDERPNDLKHSDQAPEANSKPSSAPREAERLVDQLIVEYRNPPAPPEPSAEQQAQIEQVVKNFAAEDFADRAAASAAASKLGREALRAMRQATASPDAELARLARKAMEDIEIAAHKAQIARIKAVPGSAEILERKSGEAQRAWANLAMAVSAAERTDDQAAVAKFQAEMTALDGLLRVLKTIRDEPASADVKAAAAPGAGQALGN